MPKDGIQEKLRLFRGKSVAFSKGTENTIRSIGKYNRVRFTENRKAVDELWLRGQAVKTSPFHGGNTGSIPVGVICNILKRVGYLIHDISLRAPLGNVRRCGSIGRAADL